MPGAELLRSTDWLAAHLEDPNLVVIHVDRGRADYDRAHLPGARFLSVDALGIEREKVPNELPPIEDVRALFEGIGVTNASRVVLYGGMGGLAPARAFFALDVLGRPEHVSLLDGNLNAWVSQGHPVSTEVPKHPRGVLTPSPRPSRVVDAEWVAAHLDDPNVLILDARPPEHFSGDAGDGDLARRGHIPGAQNLYWGDFFVDRDKQRLRPRQELRAMFESVGARRDREVVVYCRIGMQSSFAYFTSRYLGYRTRMYDGSFVDWSRREHLPVERVVF